MAPLYPRIPPTMGGDVLVEGSTPAEIQVEAGARLEFSPGVGLGVGLSGNGGLQVLGTAEDPVVFTSSSDTPAPGDWDGISFFQWTTNAEFENVVVEYGGGNGYAGIYGYYASPTIRGSILRSNLKAGIAASGYGDTLLVSDTEFSDNSGYGLDIDDGAILRDEGAGASFTGNTFQGNTSYPIRLSPNSMGMVDASCTFADNGVDAVQVRSGYATKSATWQALEVPWEFSGDVLVEGSATAEVQVEAGARLEFVSGVGLGVGLSGYGGLDVQGTEEDPVVFTSSSDSPAPGAWDGISFFQWTSTATFEHAIVEYGGGNGYAGIWSYYASPTIRGGTLRSNLKAGVAATGYNDTLLVADTEFSDNSGYGLDIDDGAILRDEGTGASFTGNTFQGNTSYPIRLSPNSMGMVDASCTFADNGVDAVQVRSGYATKSATWQALEVPWEFAGDVLAQGSGSAEIDVEAGGIFQFQSGAGLSVGMGGNAGLQVLGTAEDPVVFTSSSDSPTPGIWDGISFYSWTTNAWFENVVVEYGGGNGFGNLYFSYCNATVDTATVAWSSRYGIYRYGGVHTLTDITYEGNVSGDLY